MMELEHRDDCLRLRAVAKKFGFGISVRDAQAIWAAYSAAAGEAWLPLCPADGDLFLALREPLQAWLVENGEPPPPPAPAPRAPIMDIAADGPCEVCAAWAAAKYVHDPETGKTTGYRCDECGEVIEHMGVMRGRGFDGIRPHHYHLEKISGTSIPGRTVILQELCKACYRKHRTDVYPGESPAELERHLRV